jgi:hypothetical protein
MKRSIAISFSAAGALTGALYLVAGLADNAITLSIQDAFAFLAILGTNPHNPRVAQAILLMFIGLWGLMFIIVYFLGRQNLSAASESDRERSDAS